MMGEELTEEEILNVYSFLKKLADKLQAGTPERAIVTDLIYNVLEKRLREIAWNKYQTEKLTPAAEKKEVKEV